MAISSTSLDHFGAAAKLGGELRVDAGKQHAKTGELTTARSNFFSRTIGKLQDSRASPTQKLATEAKNLALAGRLKDAMMERYGADIGAEAYGFGQYMTGHKDGQPLEARTVKKMLLFAEAYASHEKLAGRKPESGSSGPSSLHGQSSSPKIDPPKTKTVDLPKTKTESSQVKQEKEVPLPKRDGWTTAAARDLAQSGQPLQAKADAFLHDAIQGGRYQDQLLDKLSELQQRGVDFGQNGNLKLDHLNDHKELLPFLVDSMPDASKRLLLDALKQDTTVQLDLQAHLMTTPEFATLPKDAVPGGKHDGAPKPDRRDSQPPPDLRLSKHEAEDLLAKLDELDDDAPTTRKQSSRPPEDLRLSKHEAEDLLAKLDELDDDAPTTRKQSSRPPEDLRLSKHEADDLLAKLDELDDDAPTTRKQSSRPPEDLRLGKDEADDLLDKLSSGSAKKKTE